MVHERKSQTGETASRRAAPLLCARTDGPPRDRAAKAPPVGELERDWRSGSIPFKRLAIGAAALGMLIAAPPGAEAATTAAESTIVTVARFQAAVSQRARPADPLARDVPDGRASGRRQDSFGSVPPGASAAPPSIDVDGIDDPGVRAVATTVLNIVARDIRHRLVPSPSRLKLEARSCGENSQHLAYWNRHRKVIGLCGELIQDRRQAETKHREQRAERHFYGRESRASNDRFATYDAAQSLLFIAYHELGHALVDIYDLEVGGSEEIAVDGFATWWAIQGGAASAAVHGAMTFDQFGIIEDQYPNLVDLEIHGRSSDRYRNIACWLVGAGRRVPSHFLEDLGPDGESLCRTAYLSLAQQWTEAFQ